MRVTRQILALSLLALVNACSSTVGTILPDRQVEYKKQQVAQADLEVPPDLTKSTISDAMPIPGTGDTATYSEYESTSRSGKRTLDGNAVLPEVENVKFLRDGNQRWLEIQASPEQVWQKVLAFWRENGVILLEQNPSAGVMKTDWLENRAVIKQGFITDFLRRALDSVYSSGTRDQFRVRLEPGSTAGVTELYLTHTGLEEQLVKSVSGDKENTYWSPRPNDPGLEAEMLRRIMVYMGVAEQTAEAELAQQQAVPAVRAELEKHEDGSAVLLIKADLTTAWRLVGVALERVGFTVDDRDQTAGTYFVRYEDPLRKDETGFFSSLAFWRDKTPEVNTKYRLHLGENGSAGTKVAILDDQSQPEHSETGVRILTLIQEQIH